MRYSNVLFLFSPLFQCSNQALTKEFSKFGKITEVLIPKMANDPSKKRGFGFVQFVDVTSAAAALAKMNGQEILGKILWVEMDNTYTQYAIFFLYAMDNCMWARLYTVYFVSPRERPRRQRLFQRERLVIARATCAFKKESRD